MNPSKHSPRDIMGAMVATAQKNAQSLLKGLPDKATTKGQRRLEKKHSTPHNFACACIAALGEISYGEAATAIHKYHQEWKEAK